MKLHHLTIELRRKQEFSAEQLCEAVGRLDCLKSFELINGSEQFDSTLGKNLLIASVKKCSKLQKLVCKCVIFSMNQLKDILRHPSLEYLNYFTQNFGPAELLQAIEETASQAFKEIVCYKESITEKEVSDISQMLAKFLIETNASLSKSNSRKVTLRFFYPQKKLYQLKRCLLDS